MAITLQYTYPAIAATAPSLATMQNFNMVVCTVASSASADNSAVITHDLNLPASDISAGFPRVVINAQADDTTSGWYIVSQNPNYTILGANTLNAKPTTLFNIDRPFSMDR